MLVYNPEEKVWTCQDPSEEEVKELLELGKRAVLQGFSTAFVSNLIAAEAAAQAERDDEAEVPSNSKNNNFLN